MELDKYDLQLCVRRLPEQVLTLVKQGKVVVAGGYVRACIAREELNDIDIFLHHDVDPEQAAYYLICADDSKGLFRSENAITIKCTVPIQLILRWRFSEPSAVIESFDYSVCAAAFWWNVDADRWVSRVDENFYKDLAAKRLRYNSPNCEEAVGGSMIRLLKYCGRGYRIPLGDLSKVIARLLSEIDVNRGGILQPNGRLEPVETAKVLKGLLYDVDPSLDPDGIFQEEEE